MSETNELNSAGLETQEVPAAQLPICPHCGIDPAMIKGSLTLIGRLVVLVASCGNCRKIFSVFPVPPEFAQPERPGPGLWVPNGR